MSTRAPSSTPSRSRHDPARPGAAPHEAPPDTAAAGAAVPYLVLGEHDHRVLGAADFGVTGVHAVESVGPFAHVQATGPLLMVHDGLVEAGLGIGHHPHRGNERLFYVETGELDHDDALNGITGHMATGDVGRFVEGTRGMVHREWNHGPVDARAYILVYTVDPVPRRAAFSVLADADAPRYAERAVETDAKAVRNEPSVQPPVRAAPPGVVTKELVGPRSPLVPGGDLRLFTDSRLHEGAALTLSLGGAEGGLLSVREGAVDLDGRVLTPGATTVLVPPAPGARTVMVTAVGGPARVIRVVHGPGLGLVRRDDPAMASAVGATADRAPVDGASVPRRRRARRR